MSVLRPEDLIGAFREIRLRLQHADERQVTNRLRPIELVADKAKQRGSLEDTCPIHRTRV